MLNFSENLKRLMESRGINQKWLADEANTTEATISRYVHGVHKPNVELIVDIAKALDVSVDYLLGLTPIPTSRFEPNAELRLLVECYNKADDRERENVWFQLRDYLSAEEKTRYLPSRSEAKKSGTA